MAVDSIPIGVTGLASSLRFSYYNAAKQVYNKTNVAFEAWNDSNYADYLVSGVSELGTSGDYQVTTPAAVAALTAYSYIVRQLVDSTPAADLIQGAGGYSVEDATVINTIAAQLATGQVRVIRTTANGDIEIRKGDSYGSTTGQRVTITKPSGAQWPADLTAWTITFTATKRSNNDNTGTATIGPVTCAHGTETGSSQSFHVDLTAAQTTVAEGWWTYDVQASSGSLRNTLISGNLRVLPENTTA